METTKDMESVKVSKEDVLTGMLAQAVDSGFATSEDAQAVVEQTRASAPAPEIERAPEDEPLIPAPTPGEQVIAQAEDDLADKVVEVEDVPEPDVNFQPVSDEVFAEFEEEEIAETVASLSEEDEDVSEYDEDEDVTELKRQLGKLQKQVKFQQELRAKEARSKWEADAKERFPLATLSSISATSKREFLKKAALSHNANYELLKPHIDRLNAEKARLKEQVRAEERSAAADAWGRPTTGPTVTAQEEGAFEAELNATRKTGDLAKVLGVKRRWAERGGR